jgi:YVTN family beta-propeller protein
MKTLVAGFLVAAIAFAASPLQAAPEAAYRLAGTIAIGTPDRWDYVVFDAPSGRVYVAHAHIVTVVDPKAGKVIGTINVGGTTHGVATVPALGKGYTDDGKSGTAVVFDLKTFKELHRIRVEPDADGIVFDPASGHVLVITGDSGKVSVIDPKTDTVIASIDGGGPLEFGVLAGNGKFYVDGEEKNEIVRMDLATNRVDAHWPLAGCKTPHGLAIDRAHMRLFASCGNKVMAVINARTGALITTLPIGEGTDFAEFDASRGLVFSSNREGTVSIIAERTPDDFMALAPLTTARGGRTMALDQASGQLFIVASDVTVNETALASDRARYKVAPGSAKLMIFEPVH